MKAGTIHGLGVSPGVARAPLARLAPPVVTSRADPVTEEPEAALARVEWALGAVAAEMAERAERAEGVAADILSTTSAMAGDPSLVAAAGEQLRAGSPTGHAVTLAVESFCAQLEAHGGYLAERVTDLRDIAARAVALLAGVPMPGIPAPGHPIVLTARDLSPADTATLAGSDVVALLTEEGGPTSHTAILAKSLGLPAVVGCRAAAEIPAGVPVLVDGSTGEVRIGADAGSVQLGATALAVPAASGPGRTRDDVAVALLSNVGTLADAHAAAATDSEGVGLFRTEFLFLGRRTEPSADEQTEVYAEVLRAFGERPVLVRTLDAGSDKPLPFLPLGEEENPALGVRGLRTSTIYPEALGEQLTAIAKAARSAGRPVRVMAPMVATAEEAAAFVATARAHGLDDIGVMIEVPAAALRADELLDVVDFVSIGTNDLGQYTMAADRAAGALGHLLDPWQPALLDLIAMVGAEGRERGKPVGVCGEAASDPLLAAVLVGLGVTSLSMAPVSRPAVHAELAGLSVEDCVAIARAARGVGGAAAGRARARKVRDERWGVPA
ncbi:MAG: phosphoenolpyruvate-protein phosphotransferase system enzyme [Pseudonocardiales bacterium]|nr:phosphoenolpyruvate-protein phosphotransferase system enzyme [Pseudonocardiales bacterium]MDT7679013.1 phosphoenolpyruvate-protein phosphotransferase system enzyme [Pseudonocardiales bacterium]